LADSIGDEARKLAEKYKSVPSRSRKQSEGGAKGNSASGRRYLSAVCAKGKKSAGERQCQVGLCVKSLKLDASVLQNLLLTPDTLILEEFAPAMEQLIEVGPTEEELAALKVLPSDARLDEASSFFRASLTIPQFTTRLQVLQAWLPFEEAITGGVATWEMTHSTFEAYRANKGVPKVLLFLHDVAKQRLQKNLTTPAALLAFMTGPAVKAGGGHSSAFAEDFVQAVRGLGLGGWTAELAQLSRMTELPLDTEAARLCQAHREVRKAADLLVIVDESEPVGATFCHKARAWLGKAQRQLLHWERVIYRTLDQVVSTSAYFGAIELQSAQQNCEVLEELRVSCTSLGEDVLAGLPERVMKALALRAVRAAREKNVVAHLRQIVQLFDAATLEVDRKQEAALRRTQMRSSTGRPTAVSTGPHADLHQELQARLRPIEAIPSPAAPDLAHPIRPPPALNADKGSRQALRKDNSKKDNSRKAAAARPDPPSGDGDTAESSNMSQGTPAPNPDVPAIANLSTEDGGGASESVNKGAPPRNTAPAPERVERPRMAPAPQRRGFAPPMLRAN